MLQYKVEALSGSPQIQEDELNTLAAEGWTVVSVVAAYDTEDERTYYRAFLVKAK